MSLGRQWDNRLKIWDNAFSEHFYQPIEELEITGFTTMEQLSLEMAKAEKYEPVSVGQKWGKKWEYGWFKTAITLPESAQGKRIVMTLGVAPEMLVFVNNEEAGSIDKQHFFITLSQCARAGEIYEIYAEGYAGHGPRMENAGIWSRESVPVPEPPASQCTIGRSTYGVWNEDMFLAYADYHTLYELWKKLPESSLRAMEIGKALQEFTYKADFELPEPQRTEGIVAAREILKPLLAKKNGDTAVKYTVFGQSHLDLAWLWTHEETKRKSARTYSNQLALMEKYPEYRFLLCAPTVLENLKKYYPNLYKRVQKKVEKGQFIPEGAVYIESDTNLPNGESLIQQFVRGKRWFKQEFDVDSKMAWMPDTFGFSGALPQIMKGCEVPYFATQKLLRSDPECEQFPYNIFWWEGIDGSKVLSHIYKKNNAQFTPDGLITRWEDDRNQKENIDGMFFPFGFGDGGGGPTEIMMETYLRCKDLEGLPRCEMASPIDYFEGIDISNVENTYYGELYLAWHRGTYTTQAKIKKGVRKAEFALREAQYLAGLLRIKQAKIEKENKNAELIDEIKDVLAEAIQQIEENWQILLFQEFHDILPGTGIRRVCEEAEEALERVISSSKEWTQKLVKVLAGEGAIFNSLSWNRKTENGVVLPACGYVAKDNVGGSMDEGTMDVAQKSADVVKVSWIEEQGGAYRIEHPQFTAVVDCKGCIISLKSTKTGYEYAAKPLNDLKMYQDINVDYDAWELGSMYEKASVELQRDAKIELEAANVDGCSKVILHITRTEEHFTLHQDMIFDVEKDWIDFKTKIDWYERHRILKVDFPTTVFTKEAYEEIQFGYLKRPTHKSRQFEKDMYETCHHKYAALTDGRNGIAVLNDCKFGISAQDSRLSLTLLKAPVMPDMQADMGEHEISYALYLFEGPFQESDVPKKGYEYNLEPTELTGVVRDGLTSADERRSGVEKTVAEITPSVESFFQVESPSVMIDTCKPAMDMENGVVLRMYEYMGSAVSARLYVPAEVQKIFATNMLEDKKCELPITKARNKQYVDIAFGAFEIKTLLLEV